MIKIFSLSDKVNTKLQDLKAQNVVENFRLVLRSNENLYAYVLAESKNQESIISDIKEIYANCEIEFLDSEVIKDGFYAKIFSSTDSIDIEPGRRRFDTLLDAKKTTNTLSGSLCPVITFYSYKGGMGRSTTLAAFAMHLAMHESLNIIIVDCDFEAPGFTNFFLRNPGEENQQQGFVEYFFDKTTLQETAGENLEKYTWEVEKKYCGNGSIRIMPAGNLNRSQGTGDFLSTHLNHYIEGLARVDFVSENYIINEFTGLLQSLQQAFKPDIILIDSRTGFNDIMGITAFHLSQIIIGFFRNDAQTLPGLHFFLDTVIKRTDLEPIIVNSILPQSLTLRRIIHNLFKEDVKQIISDLSIDEEWDFPIFPVGRNENLEVLGTPSEQTDDLIELIKAKEIRDYKELFDNLTDRLEVILKEKKKPDTFATFSENPIEEINDVSDKVSSATNDEILDHPPTLDEINKANQETKKNWMKIIKKKILGDTKRKLDSVNLYAENQDVEKDFRNGQFLFRNCMNDLFNLDKVVILGGKGTGKSYIYKALKNKDIVEELKRRANKNDYYAFFNMVDKSTRIIKVNKFGEKPREFKDRFWLVYTWQILMREVADEYQEYKTTASAVQQFEVANTSTFKFEISKIIENDDAILAIEKDLDVLDLFLKDQGNGKKHYITLIYDQLDEIVDPVLWNEWIPSLIDFWRFKRFSRIFGKLFVRRDLFRKLVGITNINELENQAIDIEWTQEELYAYFFKIVLSENMQDWFWSQIHLYADFHPAFVRQIRPKYAKLDQIPLEKHLLEPITTTFFGKTVATNSNTRMGESYDWFYKNLKNADDTISIRPFIDLIKFAIDNATKKIDRDNSIKPILNSSYYADRDVRKRAVERHFDDLCKNEIGNEPLNYIFEFIDNNPEFRYMTLEKPQFEEMLSKVLLEHHEKKEMTKKTVESLKELLIINGIVKKYNGRRGDLYTFAYLYKDRLGLKGN